MGVLAMPVFDTPDPILAAVELGVGDLRIAAGDRADTVVEVRPSHPGRREDEQAAEQTRVELTGGELHVKAPKHWKRWSPFSDGGSVEVSIELPAGSQLNVTAGVASVRATGTLGDTRLASGGGDVHLERTGTLRARAGFGRLEVDHVAGDADVATGSGTARIGAVDGTATVKNSNGDSWVGHAAQDLRINNANGDIAVDRAEGTVVAKTANGEVRLGAVTRGSVVAETGRGGLEIGIAGGTAAYLDLQTSFGRVDSELASSGAPEHRADTVEVRGRTGFGDIWVRRA
jgi:DUF4097 and DUF4098 domain-containing protein YvlB